MKVNFAAHQQMRLQLRALFISHSFYFFFYYFFLSTFFCFEFRYTGLGQQRVTPVPTLA